MTLLRVDSDRYAMLLKSKRMTRKALAEHLGVDYLTVVSLKDEGYPLLSRVADRIGVSPFLLVKIEGDELVVDGDRMLSGCHEAGLSRNRLADELGVHYMTLYQLSRHRFKKLSKVARAIGVSPMALLRVDQ